jgi:UDP-N-acetylglucosamine--N-acetylmuramyl-(pentapeptide) pyrophosphoryl-undecaprenol N-acetylglucosamine transferase
MKHLLIAGGGTGGHIAPAIAVGEKAEDCFRVSYACTPRPVDKLMYSRVKNTVHVLNPPRVDRGMKVLLPFTAVSAIYSARSLLKSIKADVVLGTGGYSSFYTILAAKTLGIPGAVFDSNAIPGKSNRFASRFCKLAFTGLPGGENGLKCPSVLTGVPVSKRMKKVLRSAAKEAIGVPLERPVIVFLGGSQGAKAINDLAVSIKEDVTILLQCGNREFETVKKGIVKQNNIIVEPFVDDLSLWYSAAELAVARAGGQTIAELSAFSLPAVLVPFPFAAENHQAANAAVVERAGGAILRKQEDIDPQSFGEFLLRLISSGDTLKAMSAAMESLFPLHPAKEIVSHLQELSL